QKRLRISRKFGTSSPGTAQKCRSPSGRAFKALRVLLRCLAEAIRARTLRICASGSFQSLLSDRLALARRARALADRCGASWRQRHSNRAKALNPASETKVLNMHQTKLPFLIQRCAPDCPGVEGFSSSRHLLYYFSASVA